jgi:hypothetical protein
MSQKSPKTCPSCGTHVYRGSYNGTPVYKCASPVSSCEWNKRWHDKKGGEEYRMPLGKTIGQVRRVHAEFNDD